MHIAFFSIPAQGHTNPTLPVVSELTQRGHRVSYYSFTPFGEAITAAGAEFIPCDSYLPPAPPNLDKKVGRDFSALVTMLVDTTLNLEQTVFSQLSGQKPDCIVADSLCLWGRLFAQKLEVPFVCSTTTFAFNEHNHHLMKPGLGELFTMLKGMGKSKQQLDRLAKVGYVVSGPAELVSNRDEPTIVYTTEEFQPMAECFSKQYAFVGPSLPTVPQGEKPKLPLLYISLGTVLNHNVSFYRTCMAALGNTDFDVVLSIGRQTDRAALGDIPPNFTVLPYAPQLEILSKASAFLTHCGMNSVNESIYYGVPMLLYPLQSEERAVANRVAQLGMGVPLGKPTAAHIRKAVTRVLGNPTYAQNTQALSQSFRTAGGPAMAADYILTTAKER